MYVYVYMYVKAYTSANLHIDSRRQEAQLGNFKPISPHHF